MPSIILLFFIIMTTKLVFLSSENPTLPCALPLSCVPLKNCDSLLKLIKTSPSLQSTVKFLKAQVCSGQESNEGKVCCPDFIASHKSIKKQLNESPCNPPFQCVSLLECGPLMYLVGLEKPVSQGVVKFIKSQKCGEEDLYPKVCCKVIDAVKKENFETTTTTKRTVSLKEKSEKMNEIFNSDVFDFIAFDLFVR